MQLFLDNNRIAFEALGGINSDISIPFNSGRRTGFASGSMPLFRATPPAKKIDLVTWINTKIAQGKIDVTGTAGAAVTVDQTQTITGNKTFTGTTIIEGAETLLGSLVGANMNVTTDQAIPISRIGSQKYLITRIVVTNASISLDTAAGGVYTAVSKGGTAVVANTQAYSDLTAATVALDLTLAVNNTYTLDNLYLSLTTAQGAAATADVYVFGIILP